MSHYSYYTLYYIVNISEITFAIAIVEDLDGLAFTEFVGKAEVCHIRTTSRAIDGEAAEACGRDVVELAIGMRHELVALLCCSIERDRIVHHIVS